MKSKTQLIFLIGASVSGLMIVGGALLLFMSYSKLGKVETNISAKLNTLEYLHSGNPFPSTENVEIELQNGQELKSWFETLLRTSGEGQIDQDMRTPSKFMQLLRKTRSSLLKQAGEGVVAPNFAFGFDRYFVPGSALPGPDHVSRLAQQLAIVECISGIMFEEGVVRLSSVKREVFEGGRAEQFSTGATATAGEIKEGDMYGKLRFEFEFDAPEAALKGIMNRISSNQLFIAVGTIDYTKRGSDVHEALIPEPGKTSVDPGDVVLTAEDEGVEVDEQGRVFPSRYQRVVTGPGLEVPMVIRMELNVFRFTEVPSE